MMAFHFHNGKYEAFSLRDKGNDYYSLGNTSLGFCEMDDLFRGRLVEGEGCYEEWTKDRLKELGVTTDFFGPNTLYHVIISTPYCESGNPSTFVL